RRDREVVDLERAPQPALRFRHLTAPRVRGSGEYEQRDVIRRRGQRAVERAPRTRGVACHERRFTDEPGTERMLRRDALQLLGNGKRLASALQYEERTRRPLQCGQQLGRVGGLASRLDHAAETLDRFARQPALQEDVAEQELDTGRVRAKPLRLLRV